MPNKILIVDDDGLLNYELRESLDDYETAEASDGEEALKLLKKANDIDLVILDIRMPGLNGIEVLREMKRMDPRLGVIILTGHSTEGVAIEAIKAHADDYLEKPSSVEEIRGAIEKVLDAKRGESDINTTNIKGKIEKVKRFIERNRYKKVRLEDAAQAVCLSPKYLSRVFKENSGENFVDYKLKVKINEAKALLTKGRLNINQIADKLGYENAESFTRQFKKHTGRTPTEYKKKNRRVNGRG